MSIPVAQYLRMSTEDQRFSITNQRHKIAEYAAHNNFSIVRTYEDAGKSGVVIKRRHGLSELLKDVVSGKANYKAILVYDVSRWGRFQNPDEAAHYESEGCSSCPPADRLLERFDGQPVQGAELIVLSEHVDYWNHIGWKDPYSGPFYSNRQKIYGDRFRLDGVYTPQMVVDGTTEFVGSDTASANKAIENALTSPKLRVSLSLVPAKAGEVSRVRVDIPELESSFGIREAEVYVAYALNRAESQVSGGENAGHKLAHVSVVKRMAKIGQIKTRQEFSSTFQLDHALGMDAKNGRIIVFVQEPHQGRVIGVGLVRL